MARLNRGDTLNALISDEYNVTPRRTDPRAAPSVRDPVAPVVDEQRRKDREQLQARLRGEETSSGEEPSAE